MQLNWRAISGPALTTATALLAFLVDRHFVSVPNPAPLFVCIVALAASASGIASGMASAVIAVASSALLFLNHRAAPGYDMSDLSRMLLLAVTAGGTALITGLLRQKWVDAFAWEKKHHATADRLSAALDQVDIGIVLLDSDTRAEFINRAFRDYFALSDAQADSKPPFIALMYHARDTGAWQLPEDELSAFIAKRTEMIRVGDSTPININLADGQVLLHLHSAARWRTHAELYAGHRSRSPRRRSRQRRLLPRAARQLPKLRPPPRRRGIAAALSLKPRPACGERSPRPCAAGEGVQVYR
jgi:PAS domain-containing protein